MECLLQVLAGMHLTLEQHFQASRLKVKGTGSKKNVPSGSLRVTVSGTIPFSTPSFLDLSILTMEEIMPYTGCLFKTHTTFLRSLLSCHPIGTVKVRSKGHSIFLSGLLLQDGGEHMKQVDSMVLGPLLHFPGYKLSSLIRNNIVWYSMMVIKEFIMSTDSGFGRSIMCK